MNVPEIPLATYRLQFNSSFTFAQAAELVPYLAELGISHCYASPYLRARSGSTHGYDIIDHASVNPEIGTPEDFDCFVAALHAHGMGQILDIVPNHMGIMGADNAWWLDVLENGEASPYSDFFDIDWQPVKDELQSKVLVPVLGDQYGTVLDRGELRLVFDDEKGEFSILYYQHRFPVNPREYPRILGYKPGRLQELFGPQDQNLLELQSLISAFTHLPGRLEEAAEKREERIRDKEIHKRRLAALCNHSPQIRQVLNDNLQELNGMVGDSRSFDALHELIKAQAYRLAYWRVAADDINYRRFFDVNDLAGIRMENEAVFRATHAFVLELIRQGKLNGLRIDHPDGLYNPAEYFHRLQCGDVTHALNECNDGKRKFYVVIEKILTGEERLPESWPIFGTTGYEFLNLVNGLFVDASLRAEMGRIYRGFIGQRADFKELVHRCKKLVMRRSLASELNVLANMLSRIALANRHTCDFTLNILREALGEVIACFPVYRTYITEHDVAETGRVYIERAVQAAKRRSSAADPSVFDFVLSVLLTDAGKGHRPYYQRAVVRFAMKFQQFTSVVMAKGLEDTAFYRYNRLVSLNEVGGNPRKFGTTPEEFHHANQERARLWPHSMLATSTHDTKRSEDVRARIDVHSEIPASWRRAVRRWRALNRDKKRSLQGSEAPSRNHEFLFYQTLLGTWPFDAAHADAAFVSRISAYMLKAVREAKDHTSWSNQNVEYEEALKAFVESVLEFREGDSFLKEFLPFQRKVARIGMYNGLSQQLLKLLSPGVPDLYQGTELWDLSLVDPDNRRPVDYSRRRVILKELREWRVSESSPSNRMIASLTDKMEDGRIKLFVTWKALEFRKSHCDLVQSGSYIPLSVSGTKAQHLVAFARRRNGKIVVVAVPRLISRLLGESFNLLADPDLWDDTRVWLDQSLGPLQNIFTGSRLIPRQNDQGTYLAAADLLSGFPVALVVSE